MRFPIALHDLLADDFYEHLREPFDLRPEVAYAEIADGTLEVRLGTWFHERLPIERIVDVLPSEWPFSSALGVKILDPGEVCVVGATSNVVAVCFDEPQRGRVRVAGGFGMPPSDADFEAAEVRVLLVSVDDPDGFERALRAAAKLPPAG